MPPRKLTADAIERARESLRAGASGRAVAAEIGLDHRAFARLLARQEARGEPSPRNPDIEASQGSEDARRAFLLRAAAELEARLPHSKDEAAARLVSELRRIHSELQLMDGAKQRMEAAVQRDSEVARQVRERLLKLTRPIASTSSSASDETATETGTDGR